MVFLVIACARISRYLRPYEFGFREVVFYGRCGAVLLGTPVIPENIRSVDLLNGQVEAGVAFWRRRRNHRDGRT